MANSCRPGVLNHPWSWPAARTPGTLGVQDQGDPDVPSAMGDTPGALGQADGGDPGLTLLGPLAAAAGGCYWRAPDDTWVALPDTPRPAAPLPPPAITVAQLKTLFTAATDADLQRVVDDLNVAPATYGLNTGLRRAHFFAQVRQESGATMAATVENLNYSPEALKLFKYYQDNPDEALTDGYEKDAKTGKITRKADQETIANKAYAGRIGNGNAASGDGWLFRGRGLKQVTGRANYATTTKRYRLLYPSDAAVDFEKTPELLASFPYSLRSAVCFWIDNGLHLLADAGSSDDHVDAITAVVNKKTDSYAARRGHFATAWAAFK